MTEQLALPVGEPASASVFRPIHYLGSKLRLLEPIVTALDQVDPERGLVIDLFSGSGVVAGRLVADRPVIAADVQEYARVLAAALTGESILPSEIGEEVVGRAAAKANEWLSGPFRAVAEIEREANGLPAEEQALLLAEIIEAGSLASGGDGLARGHLGPALTEAAEQIAPDDRITITRNYGGPYFSFRQALQLDALQQAAHGVPEPHRDAAVAAVLSTASDSVATVGGHFAQPIRPFDQDRRPKARLLCAAAEKRQMDLLELFGRWARLYAGWRPPRRERTKAVRADYREALGAASPPIGAVYADPPYTRDHYSRFYHVLETIARDDEPSLERIVTQNGQSVTRGLYRTGRHQSPFCIRSQVTAAFDALFAEVAVLSVPLVLSYSPRSPSTPARAHTRLVEVQQLAEQAASHFGSVRVEDAGDLVHSKLNASHLNAERAEQAEVLLLCEP